MSAASTFKTARDYIDSQPSDTRNRLLTVRALILRAAPQATEVINYDIPAYALVKGGKRGTQIMIAGYRTYVGFYTGTGILAHFAKDLTRYTVGKASVQFPNNQRLPMRLIVAIVKFKKEVLTGVSPSSSVAPENRMLG